MHNCRTGASLHAAFRSKVQLRNSEGEEEGGLVSAALTASLSTISPPEHRCLSPGDSGAPVGRSCLVSLLLSERRTNSR